MSEFIAALPYTRNESLLNTKAVDFIVDPTTKDGVIQTARSAKANNMDNILPIIGIVFVLGSAITASFVYLKGKEKKKIV